MNFFRNLWARWSTIPAPVVEPLIAPVAPVAPPAITHDQVRSGLADHLRSEREDREVQYLNMRVVRVNNAYVTRDYGRGPVDETLAPTGYSEGVSAAPFSDQELKELGRARNGIKFAKPCALPPDGWRCTRPNGHTGPCAASTQTDWHP